MIRVFDVICIATVLVCYIVDLRVLELADAQIVMILGVKSSNHLDIGLLVQDLIIDGLLLSQLFNLIF